MSWSMSCKGTAEACKRTLADAKIYGTPAAEEQAVFDAARAALLDFVSKGMLAQSDVQIAVYELAASGHGTAIVGVSFKTELIYVKEARAMAGVGVQKFGDWGKAHEICGTMAEKFKLAAERALMQEAQFMRGEIVKYMASGAIQALSPKTLATRAFTGFKGSKPLIRRGDYRNSIVAKRVGEGAFVGVLKSARTADGKSLANIAELMENGGTVVVPITPKSRRFYHAAMKAAGISLDSGSHHSGGGAVIAIVKIPARPIFGPVFEKHGKPDAVRDRFFVRLKHIFV